MQKAREEGGRNIVLWLFTSLLSFIYAVSGGEGPEVLRLAASALLAGRRMRFLLC